LARCFGERAILPGDPRYEAARRVWNGMIDRRPLAVLRCTGNEDVRAALDFAAEVDVPVAVRGGGHSVAGHGVVDGVVVIDLSPMAAVTGDEGQSRVREAFGVNFDRLAAIKARFDPRNRLCVNQNIEPASGPINIVEETK